MSEEKVKFEISKDIVAGLAWMLNYDFDAVDSDDIDHILLGVLKESQKEHQRIADQLAYIIKKQLVPYEPEKKNELE